MGYLGIDGFCWEGVSFKFIFDFVEMVECTSGNEKEVPGSTQLNTRNFSKLFYKNLIKNFKQRK